MSRGRFTALWRLGVLLVLALPQWALGQTPWTGSVQVPAGFRITPPSGWVWKSLRKDEVTFQKGETRLTVSYVGRKPDDYTTRRWEVVARLGDGTSIEWKYRSMANKEYTAAFIVREGRYLGVDIRGPGIASYKSPSEWGDLVTEFARSILIVPATKSLRHPTLGFEVDIPPENLDIYWIEADKADIDIRPRWGVARADSTIHVYPASESLRSLEAVLQDITGYFAKEGITGGPPRRLSLPGGGTALVVEAPGTTRPYMAAVETNGRYFFVSASTDKPLAQPTLLWDYLRHALGGVRSSAQE